MSRKLLVVALSLLAAAAMAQTRYIIGGNGEAVQIGPNEKIAKAIHVLNVNTPAKAAACPTTVNAGYDGATAVNFTFANGDVELTPITVPVTGIIKQIWFRSYSGPTGTDSTCLVRLMASNIATGDVGTTANANLGYYNNTSEFTGRSPYADDPGADPTWIPVAAGAKDPNGAEIWGLGGAAYVWPDADQWNVINTADLFNEPAVTKGDKINVCVRVTPLADAAPTRQAGGLNTTGTVGNMVKYYNRDRRSAGTFGWWSRIEYTMRVVIVVEAAGDLPPVIDPAPTVVRNTLSTAAQTVSLTAYDCNAGNPADTGVASADLWYRVGTTGSFVDVPMTLTSGVWSAQIPAQSPNTAVFYYCTATDIHANTSSPSTTVRYQVVDLNMKGYTTTYAAPYNFVDITGTGTKLDPASFFNTSAPLDDGTSGPYDMGSKFTGFFNKDSLQWVWIGTNGAFTLATSATDTVLVGSGFSNYQIPSSSLPRNMVAPFWYDLNLDPAADPPGAGDIWYKQSGSQFIIQWNQCTSYGTTLDDTLTFEAILDNSDKSITYQYRTLGPAANNNNLYGLTFLSASTDDYLFINRLGYPVETRPADGTAIKLVYTPAAVSETKEVPRVFALFNNYPNPFNPSTEISFSVPAGMHVRLAVYNLLGQEVATLVNEYKNAGTYTVPFSAQNMASGVYFYSIKAGNYSDVKKMVLMK